MNASKYHGRGRWLPRKEGEIFLAAFLQRLAVNTCELISSIFVLLDGDLPRPAYCCPALLDAPLRIRLRRYGSCRMLLTTCFGMYSQFVIDLRALGRNPASLTASSGNTISIRDGEVRWFCQPLLTSREPQDTSRGPLSQVGTGISCQFIYFCATYHVYSSMGSEMAGICTFGTLRRIPTDLVAPAAAS